MKNFTDEQLQAILNNINNGTVYCGIQGNRGIGRIFKTNLDNIGYQHYGSSAIKNTVENLRWLLKTIFHDCDTVTPAEWSDYHINTIPIDRKYDGVDMSRKHPNAFGL